MAYTFEHHLLMQGVSDFTLARSQIEVDEEALELKIESVTVDNRLIRRIKISESAYPD